METVAWRRRDDTFSRTCNGRIQAGLGNPRAGGGQIVSRSTETEDLRGPSAFVPELEVVNCDLCGSMAGSLLLRGDDSRYGVSGTFAVVRCEVCDLVRVSPRPTLDSLSHYYPVEYEPHQDPGLQHRSRVGDLLRRLGLDSSGGARRLLVWLYNCLAFRAFLAGAPGRILDVGCGAGAYLAVWKSLGWTVEGVEPNERAAAVAAERLGATVHVGLVEDLQLEAGRYDLVTMCHSLEHVRSPRTVLRVVHRLLSQKGRLLLMMPNFAAWERSLLGEDWYGLEIPRHLYHFEPRTLINVLEKEGFVVRSLWGSAQPDGLIRSLRHRLGRHDADRAVGPVARVVGTAVLTLPAVLRRSGRMWAVAERAEDLAGPTI